MSTTETARHTPGPWQLSQDPEDGEHVIDAPDPDGGTDRIFVAGAIFNEADAALLAAAPKMLSALRAVLLVLESDYTPDARLVMPELDEVTAAIAAAQVQP